MTAEIAIMSRSAVALAADSAATIIRYTAGGKEEKRVLKGANKMFALSRSEPVAVMIFGDASFMGVPWETLVKMYRAARKTTSFPTLVEYARDFFKFLEEHPTLFPDEAQDQEAKTRMRSYAYMVLGQAHNKQANAGKVGKRAANKYIGEEIDAELKFLDKCKFMGGFNQTRLDALIDKYEADLDSIISDEFGEFRIAKDRLARLRPILVSAICKLWFVEASAGIVFSGFGTADHFPKLVGYRCRGIFENVLLRFRKEQHEITNAAPAAIVPFAQTEMVKTFLYGIDPDINMAVTSFLNESFKEINKEIRAAAPGAAPGIATTAKKIRDQFDKDFVQYIGANHVQPLYRIVDVLAKEELAELAETLINMESLKKRITQPIESVGGPVDVAVISKAEGVIWIKRKHYFTPGLNQDYFSRVGR